MDYQPRVIRKPNTDLTYLMTCRKDLAESLVKWLKGQGIPAFLPGVEANETMDDQTYIVSQIDIEPPHDYDIVRAAVSKWPR